MMRIDKSPDGERLLALSPLKLADADYKEREHLQRMIVNSPAVFFGEIGESLLIVGEETRPRPEFVDDRIDVLALDPSGAAVVVELKRDRDKLQLLQALTYAAMVRTWGRDDFAKAYADLRQVGLDEADEALDQFLGASVETINPRQRLVLVAEHFDFEVLATAEWLSEGYGVEIRCVRISLRKDGDAHYLGAETIFPLSPLFDHAWRRRAAVSGTSGQLPASNWDEIYERITDPAIREFAETIAPTLPPKDANPKYWTLHLRVGDKRTVQVELRYTFAYVWQSPRLKGDAEFWQDRLGPEIDLQTVNGGRALRFYLRTKADCDAFMLAVPSLDDRDYSASPAIP